jgi:DNA-binding IclR family transcriptional regulator
MDKQITPAANFILSTLRERYRDGDYVIARELAEACNVHPATVRTYLHKLERLEKIRLVRLPGMGHRIHWP